MKKHLLIFNFLLLANFHGILLGDVSKFESPRDLYIDLIKKVVSNTIYEDASYWGDWNPNQREIGTDHPLVAHTMVGLKRLNNIQFCLEQIIEENVLGDCIETGVWRGGGTILMKAILKAYGDTSRKVWVADSFEGVPPPNAEKYPADRDINLHHLTYLAVPMDSVKENFRKYGLLDDQVIFLKGFFRDTLPTAPIEKISLLRLDGDLYESTMDALENLYPKLSTGGYVIIDDFGAIPACKQAVLDYRLDNQITDEIIQVDWTGVYWKKTN